MGKYSDLKFDWFGEITAKMGYGLQARRMLQPLIEGGATIKLIPDEDYLPPFMKIEDPYWKDLVEKSKALPDNDIRIMYSLPTRFQPNPKATNIGYSMWETTQYPREWAGIINSTCQVFFAGCNSLVQSAKAANIMCPIVPMNATLDVSTWNPQGPVIQINDLPPNCVKFLFIGNFIPRKNLEDLLLGFNVAFDGVKDVCLIIKTWHQNNSAEGKKHIADAIRHINGKTTGIDKPKVHLITDVLDESQIINLIRSTDSYVSVSKGEGFDLPMMQAMSMEKLIVTTRFLAHGDYLNDTNSIDVKYTLKPCSEAAAPLYDSYQYWSNPDMQSFIEGLRKAYSLIKLQQAKPYGEAARKTIIDNFSIEVNTDKIADAIRKIQNEKPSPRQNLKDVIKRLTVPT